MKLTAGETLERATIPLVHGESGSPAGEDFLRFLADTDRATAHTLATFIRKELGLRSLLVDTQASYGGLEGLRRELAQSDFIDMHAYWQHPDFAAGWNQLRFHIDNTTQVAASDGGALGSLAVYRVGGKPFTVSEYNVPAPNDYASEALPMYASIAAARIGTPSTPTPISISRRAGTPTTCSASSTWPATPPRSASCRWRR